MLTQIIVPCKPYCSGLSRRGKRYNRFSFYVERQKSVVLQQVWNVLFYNCIFLPTGQPLGPRRLSLKPVPKLPNMEAFLSEALRKVKKKAQGCLAPELCFQAVKAATEKPFADGVRKERELFNILLTSGQAQALQYAFFAERAVQRWTTPTGASWKSASPQPIRRAAVIGKEMKSCCIS